MKRQNVIAALSACALGAYGLCFAGPGCSTDNGSGDAGSGSGSGSASGSTSGSASGSASGSTSGSTSGSSGGSGSGTSSGSSSGSGDDGGTVDAGTCNLPGCVVNDCPACSGATPLCCLHKVGSDVRGTCTTQAGCSGGGVLVGCQTQTDCNTLGGVCCTVPTTGGPTGSTCVTSADGGTPSCGSNQIVCGSTGGVSGDAGSVGDPTMGCPSGGTGYSCPAASGTPINVFGVCVASGDAGGGG
jgi:hypothetical protein